MTDNIILDASVQPNELVCEICGSRKSLPPSPFAYSAFLSLGLSFEREHRNCTPLKIYDIDDNVAHGKGRFWTDFCARCNRRMPHVLKGEDLYCLSCRSHHEFPKDCKDVMTW